MAPIREMDVSCEANGFAKNWLMQYDRSGGTESSSTCSPSLEVLGRHASLSSSLQVCHVVPISRAALML